MKPASEAQVGLFCSLMQGTRLHEAVAMSPLQVYRFGKTLAADTISDLIDALKSYDKRLDEHEKAYIVGQINHLLK